MNIGLIFAGGSGVRMNTKGMPKQFLQVNGKAIIIHTLEYFERCKDIDAIVVACLEDYMPYLKSLLMVNGITKVKRIVPGGECGQESIYHGLCAAEEISEKDDIVLIHDGVRPLISEELLSNSIQLVKEKGNAITVSPATETVVQIENKETISEIIDRKNCYLAKAPQSFYLKDILKVHRQAIADQKLDRIDSASLMREYGYSLHLLEGSSENIKITNPSDFYILRAILEARENSQIFGL